MSNLALTGGTPVRTTAFPEYRSLGDEERRAVDAVMAKGSLSEFLGAAGDLFLGGPIVKALEADWCTYFSVAHAISMNSATSALYAAVGAVGVSPGDQVIVSPYTMSASATAALAWGAIPVFADVDPETFCLDPASIRARVTPKTKAIIAVDILGHPADFAAIMEIAAEYGLAVIEDAAQAPDAELNGRKAGTLAHIGVFSLNYHKHIHTGEGGVAVTDDPKLALRLQMIRNHAEAVAAGMDIGDLTNLIGQNYRMSEVHAAIGIEQLKKLPSLVSARVAQADTLTQRLHNNPVLAPPTVKTGARHVYYGYAMRVRPDAGLSRDIVAKALAAEGIGNRPGYLKPLYLLPIYQKRIGMGRDGFPFSLAPEVRYDKGLCPVVERVEDKELILMLNIHGQLPPEALSDIVAACDKIAENVDTLRRLDA